MITLINWCLSCLPTSDRRSSLRPLDLTTLAWHIFHRKRCEIEAWRSDDKTICFGNESGQYVQDTSVVGTYWLSLKVISPPFIKVQCGIRGNSEKIRRVLCWSKQKKSKNLWGFSGGIYSITGAPRECPWRILYANVDLPMLPKASAALVPFLTAYCTCVLKRSSLSKMTPRYFASADGLTIPPDCNEWKLEWSVSVCGRRETDKEASALLWKPFVI